MLRVSKGVAVGIVAGVVLFGRIAQAQTATTTTTATTSTTTTTLQPHPFSHATATCARRARRAFRVCVTQRTTCETELETAFSSCFAAPAGVKCAKSCASKRFTCLVAAAGVEKSCRKACVTTRKADKKACLLIADGDTIWAGGDAACLATADANFHLCLFGCAEAVLDCHNNFTFCIADCPNL
jgi:hypothetical protein